MKYKTSLGAWTKGITILVTILFAYIIFQQYAIIKDAGKADPIFTTTLLIAVYLIALAFRPVYYKITSDKLIIHRLISNVKIDRQNIRRVEMIDKNKISWSLRTFGIGGLFGYFGNFANTKLGRMTWYATRRDRTVLVVTNDDKKIILTPDDPSKFVSDYYS